MGLTTALLVTAAVAAGTGVYSAVDSHQTAKKSAKAAKEATLASAAAEGRATAKENALLKDSKSGAAKEAVNLDLASVGEKKKRGVNSSYTTATGAGAGMMKDTTLTPIGG